MSPTMAQPLCLRRPTLRVLCVRARLARSILAQVAKRVPVDVVMPDGTLLGGGTRRADRPGLEIVRPTALFERLAHHPKIGIGEAYMAGDWKAAEGTDLAELLMPFAERMTTAVPEGWLRLRGFVDRRIPSIQNNSLLGSRRNIEAHYDLSNDLFATFLDETMSYSSAIFDEDQPLRTQSFEEAQLRKVHAILDMAKVGQDTPRPRDRHRLGHARPRGGPPRRDRHERHAVQGAGGARPPAGRRRRLRRHRRHPDPGLPRGRGRLRRRRQRRDDRGRRRGVLGDVLPHHRRAARARAASPRSRRSSCRTSGSWPRSTPTAGSRSTSSPAGSSRASRR